MIVRKRLNAKRFFLLEGFSISINSTGWCDLGKCPICESSKFWGNPESGRIRCGNCGISLDPIAFVKMRHKLNTIDAAKRIGIWVDAPAGSP